MEADRWVHFFLLSAGFDHLNMKVSLIGEEEEVVKRQLTD